MTTRQTQLNRFHTMWRQRLAQLPFTSSANSEAGLTLLECLAAIIVMGMIGAAIAPVLVLSVATRVQSQKSEQALAIAQGEIDRIRVLIEQTSNAEFTRALESLPQVTSTTDIEAVGPPSTSETPVLPDEDEYTNLDQFDKTVAVFVDTSDNKDALADADFVVQRFRINLATEGEDDTDPADDVEIDAGFLVGVRVYDYRAITEGGTLSTEEASLALTSGQGDRFSAPLATLYTSVFRTAQGNALCDYIDFADARSGSTTDKPLGCE